VRVRDAAREDAPRAFPNGDASEARLAVAATTATTREFDIGWTPAIAGLRERIARRREFANASPPCTRRAGVTMATTMIRLFSSVDSGTTRDPAATTRTLKPAGSPAREGQWFFYNVSSADHTSAVFVSENLQRFC
jgi:hypothetical protein